MLLLGTSAGWLLVLSSVGQLLHRQRLHSTACLSITGRTWGQGLDSSSVSDDITLCFEDAIVLIPASEVRLLAQDVYFKGIQGGQHGAKGGVPEICGFECCWYSSRLS